MKKSLLRSFLCYVWYVLATLIILIAVLSASLKALTPVLNEYKPDIERYLSHAIGEKVSIGSLNAHWERFGPQVDLKQIILFYGDQPFLKAEAVSLHIGLSLLDSLTIHDMKIEIQETSPHHYLINHLKTIKLNPNSPSVWSDYWTSKQRLQLMGIHFSVDLLSNISHLEGQLDAKLNSAAQHVKAEVFLRDMLIKRNQKAIPIQHLSGSVDVQRDEKGWFLKGHDIRLEDEHFNVSYRDTPAQNRLSIERLRLSSLLHWLKIWGIYSTERQADGEVSSFELTIPKHEKDYRDYPFDLTLTQFYLPSDEAFPGIDTLNIHASGSLAKASFEANAKKAWFTEAYYFQHPIDVEKLYIEGAWQLPDAEHLDLQIRRVAATANNVNISASLWLKLALKKPLQSWMSLVAGFQADRTADLKASIPLRLFPDSVQTWVNHAVGEGEGAEGTVIVRGRLNDFPYPQHNGVFLVDAHVKPFQLNYIPGWPSVYHLSSHLVFYNEGMLAKIFSADILGADISQASVRIPSFMQELHVIILTEHADFPKVNLVIEGPSWHIQADYVGLFGIPFHGLSIEGEKRAVDQLWRVNAKEANGVIIVPVDLEQPISAEIETFTINMKGEAVKPSVIAKQASKWPALSLHVHQLMFNQQTYSDVFFVSHPLPNGIEATRLDFNDSATQLRLTGEWTSNHKNSDTTHVKGVLISQDAGKFLARHQWANLHIDSAKAKMNLSWDATPWQFSLASLTGEASLSIQNGVIPMDESASKMGLGKVLSLFSTQSIERRLRLDFSDLGGDGYSFNTLKSQLTFDDGDAYLDKTEFNGPQAKIDVVGRCGLAKQDYDIELTVTPYVTSTIPIIATIAGGPIVGAVTYAMDKLFGSNIDQLNAYHYVLQGSWSQPVLVERR